MDLEAFAFITVLTGDIPPSPRSAQHLQLRGGG